MGGSRGLHPTFRGVRAKGGPQPGTTTTQGSPSFSWGEPRALVLSRGLGGHLGFPHLSAARAKGAAFVLLGHFSLSLLLDLGGSPHALHPPAEPSSVAGCVFPTGGRGESSPGGGSRGCTAAGSSSSSRTAAPHCLTPSLQESTPRAEPPPPSSCRMRPPPPTPGRSQALRPPRHPHAGGSTAPSSLSRGLPPQGRGEAGDRRRLGTGGGRGSPELPLASRYQDPHPSPAGRRALGAGCQAQCSSSPQATGGSGGAVARTPPSPCPPPPRCQNLTGLN